MMPWSTSPNDGYAALFWLTAPFLAPVVLLFLLAIPTAVGILASSAAAASLARYPELVPWSPARLRAWKAWVWVPFVGPGSYAIGLIGRRRALGRQEWRTARALMDRRARPDPNSPPRISPGLTIPGTSMLGSGPPPPRGAGDAG